MQRAARVLRPPLVACSAPAPPLPPDAAPLRPKRRTPPIEIRRGEVSTVWSAPPWFLDKACTLRQLGAFAAACALLHSAALCLLPVMTRRCVRWYALVQSWMTATKMARSGA
jgi:hypothetical protein